MLLLLLPRIAFVIFCSWCLKLGQKSGFSAIVESVLFLASMQVLIGQAFRVRVSRIRFLMTSPFDSEAVNTSEAARHRSDDTHHPRAGTLQGRIQRVAGPSLHTVLFKFVSSSSGGHWTKNGG